MSKDIEDIGEGATTLDYLCHVHPWLKILLDEKDAQKDAQIAELEGLFDLRWKADQRAIKRWQVAHPGNDLVWPDHTDLVLWLMKEEAEQAQPPLVT